MNAYLPMINEFASGWWAIMWPATCQSAVVGILLLSIVAFGRRFHAPVRHGLLSIALIKFAVPPLLTIPLWNAAISPFAEFRGQTSSAQASSAESGKRPADFGVHDANASSESMQNAALEVKVVSSSRSLQEVSPESWVFLVYLSGVGVTLGWIATQWLNINRILSNARPVSDELTKSDYLQLCEQFQLSRVPRLLVCKTDIPPFAVGVLSPKIVLPESTLHELTRSQLRTVLAHEISHHVRGDCWTNFFQAALFAVWWFHPVLWILTRKFVEVREDRCDDMLLSKWPEIRVDYCNALAIVAKWPKVSLPVAVGTSLPTHQLVRRFRRIADDSIEHPRSLSVRSWLVLIVASAFLLPGIRSLRSAEPPSKSTLDEARVIQAIRNVGGTATRDKNGNVVDITFWEPGVIDSDLDSLHLFPHLKSIHCRGTLIGDAGLLRIANIKSLEKLYFEGCKRVTDDGIRELADLPNLKDLGIGNTSVTDKGLVSIATFKKLEMLELSGCPITNKGVMELIELEGLRLLFLSRLGKKDSLVSEETVEILQDFLPQCKIIHEAGNPIEARLMAERAAADAEARKVERSRRIRSGFVVNNAEEAVAAIKSLPAAIGKDASARSFEAGVPREQAIADVGEYHPEAKIIFVDLDNYGVDDRFVGHLRYLPDLEIVSVSRNPISDESLQTLCQLKMLRVLHLDGTRVTDEGLRHVSELRNLSELRLTATSITDEGLRHLSGLTSLKELMLWDTRITDAGLKRVAALDNLEHLGLVQTPISDAGLHRLTRLSNLKWLDIRGTKVSKEAVDSLTRALPECRVDFAPDYHFAMPK